MTHEEIEAKIQEGLAMEGTADEKVILLQTIVESFIGSPDFDFVLARCNQLMYDLISKDRGDEMTIEFD